MQSPSPTRSSLLCVRSATIPGRLIEAWDGDHTSHVAIRIEQKVIDATLRHGVKAWDLDEFMRGRTLVDDVPFYPTSLGHQQTAEMKLFDRIGQKYDRWEIAGFVLLRDLGDPERPVCSRLTYDYGRDICNLRIAGRQGRVGPRLMRSNLVSFNDGLLRGGFPTAPSQPS